MTKKFSVKPDQAKVLEELEKNVGESFLEVDVLEWDTFGFKIDTGNVVGIGMFNRGLTKLPDSIGNLSSLEELYLGSNKLVYLPESIGKLKSLQKLFLRNNNLISLPDSIGSLSSLKELYLLGNQLSDLPKSMAKLKSLQIFGLGSNQFKSVPTLIGNLKSLLNLSFRDNKLKEIPESIGNLKLLFKLNLNDNKLEMLPKSIGNLKSLDELFIWDNKIETLPDSIGGLKSLQTLNLSRNKLEDLPDSIGNLSSLKRLYLEENNLIILPDSIGNLKSLKSLYLRDNQLTALPDSIGNLQSIRKLFLNRNSLAAIPASFSNFKLLKNLDLRINKLTNLPNSMCQLTNLKSLKLGGNPWEGEWRDMATRDIPSILNFCKRRSTINIFISHTVSEFDLYKINDFAEYLEGQTEINHVFFCEKDLTGNIDGWMEEKVPQCELLLFIGTQKSILSRDCTFEILIARQNDIPIIPIKGIDTSWKDLAKIGLSRELGFEFEKDNFENLCERLVTYIYDYKRKRDLSHTRQEREKFEKVTSEIINLIKINLKYKKYKDAIEEIETLKQKCKSGDITFNKFWSSLGLIFNEN
jgi:Leucine-rich repeat (LRR) protein